MKQKKQYIPKGTEQELHVLVAAEKNDCLGSLSLSF